MVRKAILVAVAALALSTRSAFADPLADLAALRNEGDATKLVAAESVIDGLTADVMRASWEICRSIIANPESPAAVRVRLTQRVLTAGDSETKGKLIQLLTEWESQPSGERLARDPESNSVLYTFLDVVGNPLWDGWKTNAEAVLGLLELDPIHGGFEGIKSGAAIVADAPIADAVKAEWIVRVTLANRSTGEGTTKLLSLIDDRGLTRLRDALALSVKSGSLNDCVASRLAHLGDVQSLPLLNSYVETSPERKRPMTEIMPYWRWQIEVQHPPTKILEWFRSGVEMQNAWYARWAAPRALELGFTKDQLRDALLTFERSLPDETVQAGRVKNYQMITRRPSVLIDLKADMIKAGVLRLSDWKKVPSDPALQLGR